LVLTDAQKAGHCLLFVAVASQCSQVLLSTPMEFRAVANEEDMFWISAGLREAVGGKYEGVYYTSVTRL
jgi:hypothetical protein